MARLARLPMVALAALPDLMDLHALRAVSPLSAILIASALLVSGVHNNDASHKSRRETPGNYCCGYYFVHYPVPPTTAPVTAHPTPPTPPKI